MSLDLTAVKITQIDLDFAKNYLKVDYDDEDNLISVLILAAKSYIQTALGFSITSEWTTTEEIPDELTVAALLLISHWFENRKFQTTVTGVLGQEMAFAVSALIDAHKRPLKDYDEDPNTFTWNDLEFSGIN
jgi:uncharacterized phage protein (predicted DNA packaging)